MNFIREEWQSAKRLIGTALEEDRTREDVTVRSLVPQTLNSRAEIKAKETGVLSGVGIAREVFRSLDPKLKVQIVRRDGQAVRKNDRVLQITGPTRAILSAERTALNFLGHLSGIASLTHKFVKRARPYGVRVLDTRKTTPGLRLIEKYAVRCGGGVNHRNSLADAVFIKDNHWKILSSPSLGKPSPLDIRSEGTPPNRRLLRILKKLDQELIVEVENDRQLKRALVLKPDVILFDNMTPKVLKKFCSKVRKMRLKPRPQLEVSGGVTLDTVRAYAASGVDRISVGALTHSARSLNFSLEVL